ncbi:MAG: glutaredoxin [Nitrospirae bacterium]|nr:MAG: glutaredoxin [Nitrospirota bacterium]
MTLYHTTWCPECALVRRKLDACGFRYESVIVPDLRPLRRQVYEVSGQYYVPVLVDGTTVLTETEEILAYLDTLSQSKQPPAGTSQGSASHI